MKTLTWHGSTGAELAELLIQAKLEESAAVSGATVYRLMHGGVEKIAISLSDGQVLIIQPEGVNQPRRRRLELQAPHTVANAPCPQTRWAAHQPQLARVAGKQCCPAG